MSIDASAHIAPTAKVHPEASIGPRTRIGEFCVIESDVVIGADCMLEPYVFIKRWTTMGDRNEISAGTALGTDPFDKNFTGARSYLNIGHDNKIREHFTISRGTAPESSTVIGDGNYIMSSGHIAHNCSVGSLNVIASCSLLAGHVEVADQAFISGNVCIHQFCKIGRLAMLAGGSTVSNDAPPFTTCAGFHADVVGLNLVGLQRAGFSPSRIGEIKRAYRLLFRSGLLLKDALVRIETEIETEDAHAIIDFARRSKRGMCRERRRPTRC